MKFDLRFACVALTFSCSFLSASAAADVELPSVFTDHLVLQRDRVTPIWGKADPGEDVTVAFNGKSATAKAGADGHWSVSLPAQGANAVGQDLVVTGTNRVVIRDVVVGEVWICSGQSNMEWSVRHSNDAENEILGGNHPRIRHFKAAHSLSYDPEFSVPGSWSVCSPDTVADFSAVGYFFGRELLATQDVPIGLIGTNWGGTRAEPWTDPEALAVHSLYKSAMREQEARVAAFKATTREEREARYREELAAQAGAVEAYWKTVTAQDPGTAEGWQRFEYSAEGWDEMALPGLWEQSVESLATYDGLLWFRREITIPSAWAKRALKLKLGAIDDSDVTYFNGVRVGGLVAQHATQREYTVPQELVRAGKAVIAVLAYDTGGAGGFSGPSSALQLLPVEAAAEEALSLTGSWSWKRGGPPGQAQPPAAIRPPHELPINSVTPGAMYNAMIHPFVPYAIRGAIWYQGESNAGQPTEYRELLPLMIASWRQAFGQGDFPFGVVQLASFYPPALDKPVQGAWAELRDAQLHTARTVRNVGLVVASDIGNAHDIHPRNKQEVGRRLALWARATVYGDSDLEYSGPVHERTERRAGELVLHFKHAAGLTTRDGEAPAGFAIAGEDGRFVWADARLDGTTVVLSSESVPSPTAARYGWCNNLEHLNLVNGSDLPATPFRTDGPNPR